MSSDMRTVYFKTVYLLIFLDVVASQPCPKYLAVNITDGEVKTDLVIQHNGIVYDERNYFRIDNDIWGCVCNITKCIRKCCNKNQVFVRGKCVDTENGDLKTLPIYNRTTKNPLLSVNDFYVLHGKSCPETFIPARAYADVFVQSNGTLFYSEDEFQAIFGVERYCVDYFGGEISALLCEEGDPPEERVFKGTGMIISMPFLLVTFVVYLILPERNLHRKALMSYVSSLLVAYICLVTIQLYSGQFPDGSCHALGYLIIFFFLVSFFWMNVMCVDMWLAFSGMRTFLSKKTAERKRFIIYCIYAWGMPIIHVIIVFLLNTYSDTDALYYPEIGVRRCFLGEGMPTFYYFYLPMAILIGINISLFILTTVRIQRIKKETSMLKQTDSKRHSYEDDKQKFNLYLKLMFAMGVNWTMELVSWAVDYTVADTPTFVWYLTDCTNAMYGVLIFLIFVFKKKIWRSLKKRLLWIVYAKKVSTGGQLEHSSNIRLT